MKKYLLVFIIALISVISRATVHIVNVSNFQFSPSTVNAVVGDTITWVWVSGFHTTSSLTIPAGAASWDAPIQTAGATFSYVALIAGTYNYQCNIHPASMQGVLNVTTALPVTLSAFTISAGKNNTALLSWKTSTEINTAYFSVRKSYDGNTFKETGQLPAAGNSTTEKTYNYSDENVGTTSKYIFYMLAIVDKDGSTQYYDIKMFRNNAATTKLIVNINPNPIKSTDHLMIQFNADKAGQMFVQLFNSAGKLVQQTQMTAFTGLNNGHFHLSNLAAGTYNIVFSLNGMKETYSIVVQ